MRPQYPYQRPKTAFQRYRGPTNGAFSNPFYTPQGVGSRLFGGFWPLGGSIGRRRRIRDLADPGLERLNRADSAQTPVASRRTGVWAIAAMRSWARARSRSS